MADAKTMQAYAENASAYCADWLAQALPVELLPLIHKYFLQGCVTADIGCGSGREVDWLNRQGFPCVGYDASPALLREAQRLFPQWTYAAAALPELNTLADASFANVLCETVLMHLPPELHAESLRNLLRILRPKGVLILSWRLPEGKESERDAKGRLYAPIDETLMAAVAARAGAKFMYREQIVSQSSGKAIVQAVLLRA